MDLVKALQALNAVKDQLTYEQVIVVKNCINKCDDALGELSRVCEDLELGESDQFLQLIAHYDNLKTRVVESL